MRGAETQQLLYFKLVSKKQCVGLEVRRGQPSSRSRRCRPPRALVGHAPWLATRSRWGRAVVRP